MCRNLHLIKLFSSMSKTDKSRRSLLGTQSCQKQLFHGLVVFFSFKSRLRALCGVLAGLGSNLAAAQVAGVGGIYPLKGSSIPSRHPSKAAVFPVPDEPHTSRKNLDLPWNTFLVSFDSTLTRSACLGFLAWCGRAGELTASSSTSFLFAGCPHLPCFGVIPAGCLGLFVSQQHGHPFLDHCQEGSLIVTVAIVSMHETVPDDLVFLVILW